MGMEIVGTVWSDQGDKNHMKAFVAYRASGVEKRSLLSFLSKARQALGDASVLPYITDLEKTATDDQVSKMRQAFEVIDGSDLLICIMREGDMSEGMFLEAGYAYGKYPIVLFLQEGMTTKIVELAAEIVWWQTEEELVAALREYDFTGLIKERSRED